MGVGVLNEQIFVFIVEFKLNIEKLFVDLGWDIVDFFNFFMLDNYMFQ